VPFAALSTGDGNRALLMAKEPYTNEPYTKEPSTKELCTSALQKSSVLVRCRALSTGERQNVI